MSEPYPDDVLQFVRENSKPFVTTTDAADEFSSVSRKTVHDRLDELVARGKLEKRVVGGNTAVWYIAA